MPDLRVIASGLNEFSQAWFTLELYNLQNDAHLYDNFEWTVNGGNTKYGGSTSGKTVTMTFSTNDANMSCGTSHSFVARAMWAGVWYAGGSTSGSVACGGGSDPVPGNVPAFSGTVGHTTMEVSWNAATYATSYNYWLFRGATYIDSGNQASRTYSRTGLLPGEFHLFMVEGKNSSGTSPQTTSWAFETTSPALPGTPGTPIFSEIGSDRVTCTWGAATGADSYDWQLRRGEIIDESRTHWVERYAFFAGLLAGTTYTLRIWGRNAGGLSLNYSSASFTTLGGARPANWTWTSAELTAFDGNGNFNTLTASRWNEFLNRINAFAQYKGISLMSSQLERTSGQPLTAFIFNTVCSKINEIPGASLALDPYRNRVTGNTVVGSYFKTMASELNKIT
jgi:hypothetical protein